MKKQKKYEWAQKWYHYLAAWFNRIIDVLLILFTFLEVFLPYQTEDHTTSAPKDLSYYFLASVAVVILVLKVVFILSDCSFKKKYNLLKKQNDLSKATLYALKNASAIKSRTILRTTYGRVPQWHPIDYTKNVLVYDVHEQIRSVLLELQKLIVEVCDGLTEENVTVDFVYCYPKQTGYDGSLPVDPDINRPGKKQAWRLITSGNHSQSGHIHFFLEADASFYHYVDTCGYAFYNDKCICAQDGHYIPEAMDKRVNDGGMREGSIVGLKIELKNDEPERVFVKGILTITTYGKRLYYKESGISEKDYQDAFELNVLNNYKSLILSELAQMYIRHEIKDGNMCPKTGAMRDSSIKKIRAKKLSKACYWSGKKCAQPHVRCDNQTIKYLYLDD